MKGARESEGMSTPGPVVREARANACCLVRLFIYSHNIYAYMFLCLFFLLLPMDIHTPDI